MVESKSQNSGDKTKHQSGPAKKARGAKARAAVEAELKKLDEKAVQEASEKKAMEALEREEDALEKKLRLAKEAEEAPIIKSEPPVLQQRKYVRQAQQTEERPTLEGELIADRPPVAEKVTFGGSPQKDYFRRDIAYSEDVTGQKVLETLVHYMRREGLDPQALTTSSASQQMIVQKVTEYFGNLIPAMQVQKYLSSLRETGLPDKPESKYRLKVFDIQ